MAWIWFFVIGELLAASFAERPANPALQPCDDAWYLATQYTCYDGDFLCPVLDGQHTLRCGSACYNPDMYGCSNGELLFPPPTSSSGVSSAPSIPSSVALSTCSQTPTTQHLSSPPYENYFYSDCHSQSQIVVTSPQPDSNLTYIGPRLIVAWPAGDSGICTFFAPQNGINGTLGIKLVNGTGDQPLSSVYIPPNSNSLTGDPVVGVSTLVHFNSSAVLTIPILGSIREIRDFTEGPSLLHPIIQDANVFSEVEDGGAMISRLWLDNKTITSISFVPTSSSGLVKVNNRSLELPAGTYKMTASFDYPQMVQLSQSEAFNKDSQFLLTQNSTATTSLSFLSYTEKLLAGAWRFLTYFGRDSMITLLLMQPVLSEGQGGAIEAIISSVLERLNHTTGQVCHEETIGDYATFVNLENNITSNAPSCTYIMVDTDRYLMPVIQNYFLKTAIGQSRQSAFFAKKATLPFGNEGMTYGELARINAEHIMNSSIAFAQPGGQKQENLVHLLADQIVGDWRDSTYGIGGGRIPYDVNTALQPAALHAIAALAAAGFFPGHPEWNQTAAEYAQVWEDQTLHFFEVTVPQAEAKALVTNYTSSAGYGFPSHSDDITSDIIYHGLSLDGYDNQPIIKVLNSDDSFRLLMLNSTNQTQLTSFINSTANNVLHPFPVGLSSPVGMLIANPAYGGNSVYAANWTNNAYQGTVVWSFPMAMMAKGFQLQLARCGDSNAPDFCSDNVVRGNVVAAYNHLWDIIEANSAHLATEMWTWIYQNGEFVFTQLGQLPPPPGSSYTEADIIQLWSLTFLAVTRDMSLR